MKPETIRKIDISIGRATCFFMTCLRRIVDSFDLQKTTSPPIKKILFIKLIEQGATVIAYGAIYRAVEMVGRENVFFCVFEENREILDIMDVLPSENVFVIRNSDFFTFLSDVLRLLIKIRRHNIDATVDMEFFARAPAILSYLTGAKRRVGLHRFTSETPYRGDLMTHRVQYNPYLHTSITYNSLVEALKIGAEETPLLKIPVEQMAADPPPRFVPTAEEKSRVGKLLRESFGQGVAEGHVVLLNPNASDMLPLRKWAAENFVNLGKRILNDHSNVSIVITGAPSEEEAADVICRKINSPRAVSFAGKTTLRELLVLYTLADVLVTNDSGPSHFASMTQIDSVVLYGPETPKLFGATGGHFHSICAGFACSPCVNVFNHRFSPCTNNVCMQMISVEKVYDKVQSCLQKRKSLKRGTGV
ncbi:MAG: glycosyltransferase family 9 protein [Syntrophales bacterium]